MFYKIIFQCVTSWLFVIICVKLLQIAASHIYISAWTYSSTIWQAEMSVIFANKKDILKWQFSNCCIIFPKNKCHLVKYFII